MNRREAIKYSVLGAIGLFIPKSLLAIGDKSNNNFIATQGSKYKINKTNFVYLFHNKITPIPYTLEYKPSIECFACEIRSGYNANQKSITLIVQGGMHNAPGICWLRNNCDDDNAYNESKDIKFYIAEITNKISYQGNKPFNEAIVTYKHD